MRPMFRPVPDIGDAGGPSTLDDQTGHMRAGHHSQVRPVPDPPDQRCGSGPFAVRDIHVKCGAAILVGAVVILGRAVSRLADGVQKGLFQGMEIIQPVDRDRAVRPAIVIRPAPIALHRPEMRQNSRISPSGGASRLPPVEISPVPAHKNHAVERG